MGRVRVLGLAQLKAKIERLPPAAKAAMKEKNLEAARRQADGARIRLVEGDPERGHLQDTIRIEKGETETGSLVRVGGPTNPYPLSLEVGHKAADGSHVPRQPYWYPSRADALKVHKRGMKKLIEDAVQEIIR